MTFVLCIWWSFLGAGVAAAADRTPCALLSTGDVEAVLGEPLAGPPFRASNGLADPEGDSCRYETPGFRAIDVSVDWSDGGRKFGLIDLVGSTVDNGDLKGVMTLSDGATVHGAWDQARDFLCCQFNALSGERLVVVDIGASRATLEQAASLADLAVQRLDHPLPFDDAPGLAAALERAKARPTIGPACALATRAEVEAIVGAPLTGDPQGGETSCTYEWAPAGAGYTEQLSLAVTWRGGLSEMRQTQASIGQALSFMSSQGLPSDQTGQSGGGLFDEEAESLIGVMAVRKDVLLSIETGGVNNDLAAALIAVAAKKL